MGIEYGKDMKTKSIEHILNNIIAENFPSLEK
jgi:hypothetical protein